MLILAPKLLPLTFVDWSYGMGKAPFRLHFLILENQVIYVKSQLLINKICLPWWTGSTVQPGIGYIH